jgi:hypothetical protein
VQLAAPVEVWNVPTAQRMHWVESAAPAAEYVPTPQLEHEMAPWVGSEKSPAAQGVQLADLALPAYWPPPQSLQRFESTAPLAPLKVPGEQLVHVCEPDAIDAKVPAGHAVHSAAPAAEKVPLAQLVQPHEFAAPDAGWNRPAAHGVHTAEAAAPVAVE